MRESLHSEVGDTGPKCLNRPLPSRADLVVIGGGMCGASTARHAAEVGKQVVLLEAATIGSGMTGMSAGHAMTGFLPSPAEMVTMLGPEETLRLQRWSHESKLALRRRWIDLGLGHTITDGYLLVARTRDEREVLHGIAAYWSERIGIDGARVIVRPELASYIRSPSVDSALYDPTSFSIDPSSLKDGLRRLVGHPGIDVHEETQVVRVGSCGRHRIETARGTMTAEHVAICTGASSVDFVDGLESPMTPKPTLVGITDPIPCDVLREFLPSGIAGSDCSHDPVYWTVVRNGRVLFGCGGEPNNVRPGPHLRKRLAELVPELAGLGPSDCRQVHLDTTTTGLPVIQSNRPNLKLMHGFCGVGLATGYGGLGAG